MLGFIKRLFKKNKGETEKAFVYEDVQTDAETEKAESLSAVSYTEVQEDVSVSKPLEQVQIIDTVSVFCDVRAYNYFKERISEKVVPIILDPENISQHFSVNGSVVDISPCYFARYMSPFRDGHCQGPALPPMRVLDKLRLRLYDENAVGLYNAVLEGVKKITEDCFSINIYSYGMFYTGFFADCGFLARHISEQFPELKVSLNLYMDLSKPVFLGEEICECIANAVKEEVEYLSAVSVDAPVKIKIGPYDIVQNKPLFDKCEYMMDKNIVDISEMAFEKKSDRRGWPYFHECKWNNIGYDGFTPDDKIIEKIIGYERADKDGGFHLYTKDSDG